MPLLYHMLFFWEELRYTQNIFYISGKQLVKYGMLNGTILLF